MECEACKHEYQHITSTSNDILTLSEVKEPVYTKTTQAQLFKQHSAARSTFRAVLAQETHSQAQIFTPLTQFRSKSPRFLSASARLMS